MNKTEAARTSTSAAIEVRLGRSIRYTRLMVLAHPPEIERQAEPAEVNVGRFTGLSREQFLVARSLLTGASVTVADV